MSAPSRATAYLLLAGSMALVGTYVALSKPLTAALPVFLLAFLRFAIAAVAMLPWSRRHPGETKLTATEHRLFFVMSFFGNFLFSLCMLYGISMTTATAAGVILATLPAVVALLSWLLLREHLTRRVVVAVILAVGGIALLQLARPTDASSRGAAWLGNLLLFGAVLCEATYVIVAKRLAATRAPLRVSALVNLWGLVLITPFGLWQLGKTRPPCRYRRDLVVARVLFARRQPFCRVDVGRGTEICAGKPGRSLHGRAADRSDRGRHARSGRVIHRGSRSRPGARQCRRRADRHEPAPRNQVTGRTDCLACAIAQKSDSGRWRAIWRSAFRIVAG